MQGRLWPQLGSVIWRYRWRYLLAFGTVAFANILLVINPLVFRYAVTLLDETLEPQAGILKGLLARLPQPVFTSVYPWAAMLLLLATGASILMYAMRMAFAVSRNAEEDVRRSLFVRLQQHSQAFFDRHQTGELMSRLVNDLSLYREVLGPGLLYPAIFVTLVIPAFFGLASISWRLSLIAMLPVLALPPLMLSIRRLLYQTSLRVQESLASMSTLAQEDYSSVRLIKAYGAESVFSLRFRRLCQTFLQLSSRLLAAQVVVYPLLRMMGKVVTGALVVVSGVMIVRGAYGLTSADVVSFMWLQSYVLLPVLMLGWVLPLYQKGRGAYERMAQLLSEPTEVTASAGVLAPIFRHAPSIEITGLTFSYPSDGGIALDDLHAQIPAGSLVGITGPPGSGKTTLFRLLHRDYAFGRGMIGIDGVDVHDYPLQGLRKSAAVVEQEPFLFSRTLGANIALGKAGATAEEIAAAAERAQLSGCVADLPAGFATPVGERGVTLSGGEKQRVALARALLVQTPLLLLDDVFSALDTATASAVIEQICQLKGNATVLLITHRVALLSQMDWLLYLAGGRLVEEGTPSELERSSGRYAALVELERLSGRGGL